MLTDGEKLGSHESPAAGQRAGVRCLADPESGRYEPTRDCSTPRYQSASRLAADLTSPMAGDSLAWQARRIAKATGTGTRRNVGGDPDGAMRPCDLGGQDLSRVQPGRPGGGGNAGSADRASGIEASTAAKISTASPWCEEDFDPWPDPEGLSRAIGTAVFWLSLVFFVAWTCYSIGVRLR